MRETIPGPGPCNTYLKDPWFLRMSCRKEIMQPFVPKVIIYIGSYNNNQEILSQVNGGLDFEFTRRIEVPIYGCYFAF